jgi:N-sulfoglucosamine sulfohydrolase
MKSIIFPTFFFLINLSPYYLTALGQKNQNPPNIIWLIAEDMSQDQGCYGNELVKTPTIDKLATEGMRFTNMFTTAAVCAPSRTAIATGMYQTSIGAMHMRYSEELKPRLPEGIKTIAFLLKEQGYQTLGIGKDDYLFSLNTNTFEYDNIDDLKINKPFFAKVNSHYTHREFDNDFNNPIESSIVKLPPYYPNVRPIREDWAAYLENVQLLDNEVNEILDNFEKRGLLDNTIIFFFSDHGRPFLRAKYWTYDSGIRIPFIVHFPKEMAAPKGFQPGVVSHQLLSAIDISATTLALAGVNKPEYMQGRVFLGEQAEKERDYIFSSIDRISGTHFKTRAVRSKKYKYIKNFNNGRSVLECTTEYARAKYPGYNTVSILDTYNKLNEVEKTLVFPLPVEELYDIEKDPHEINNLAYKEEFGDVRKKMEAVLTDWIKEIDDKGFQPDSPEIQKHFIDVRTNNKERYADERLKMYLKVMEELKEERKL